jgi:hypothetical protein
MASRDTRSTKADANNDSILQKLESYFEQLNKKLDDNVATLNRSMEDKIEKLRTDLKCDLKAEFLPKIEANRDNIASNTSRINQLEAEVEQMRNNLEMSEKSNDLIIKGIPTVSNEVLQTYYRKIAVAIGFEPNDIPRADIFRLGRKRINSEFDPPILLKFTNKLDKTLFHNLYFAKLDLNLTILGFEVQKRIFISENLSKKNQKIFSEAMKMKRDKKIASVNTHFGTVSITKKAGDHKIEINELAELLAM